MSIKVMTYVWDGFPGSGSEMLAMLALADWCNDHGGSLHPSMRAVAEKIRVSEKQARRIIRSFEDAGYLKVVGNEHGGAPGTTKQYQLDVARLRAMAEKRAEQTPPADVTHPAGAPPQNGATPPTGVPPTPPTGVPPTPPTGVPPTPPMDVTPPMGVTPPPGGRVRLPPVGGYPSHGCPETAPMGGSQTTSEPPVNHQLTTRVPMTVENRADAESLDAAIATSPPKKRRTSLTAEMQAACRAAWDAYCEAYAERYGIAPVKNAKVASHVVSFVKRVPMSEAPDIAAWYVQHPGRFYVERGHGFGCLLVDAEKLRTEWATGRVMTSTVARQSDRRGAMAGAVANLLAECKV